MTVQVDPEGTERRYLHRYADFLPARTRVLEVGCGDGRLTWLYADQTRLATGVDLHSDDLRVAMIDRPSNLVEKVGFARADAVHLPFPSNQFDLAIFAWSF
jgi:ubiquinone/menaquinone biosynthesis C-methylase UbiE